MICFSVNLQQVEVINSDIGSFLKTKEPYRWFHLKLPDDINISYNNLYANICVSVQQYKRLKLFRFDSRNPIYNELNND